MLVREEGAGDWHEASSEMRVDDWRTYVRAAVSGFSFWTLGSKVYPSNDPAPVEHCRSKYVIEVLNATDDEVYFVLVPATFTSDISCHVTYTGSIGVSVAGVAVDAAGSSGKESAEKRHLIPVGFTPDDMSVPAGGKFPFVPQSGET